MRNDLMKAESNELIDRIVAENDPAELEKLTRRFQQIQLKKSMIRADKLGDAIEMLDDELIMRLRSDPDSIKDKDVVAYMNATQGAINSINRHIDKTPAALIQVNNVEIGGQSTPLGLNSTSRQKVLGVLQRIIGNSAKSKEDDIIDL